MFRTFDAETSSERIEAYGTNTPLTRTFEYCDKLVASRAYLGNEIEALIATLAISGGAQIIGKTLELSDPKNYDIRDHQRQVRESHDWVSTEGAAQHGWIADHVQEIGVIRPL
ncbi:hypothetical protein [Leifsonia aquatica]|uniref:hypothetical protein n=1 Tax=Leifsonia aquatica TaxID=144185 RepID=UPI00382C3DA8